MCNIVKQSIIQTVKTQSTINLKTKTLSEYTVCNQIHCFTSIGRQVFYWFRPSELSSGNALDRVREMRVWISSGTLPILTEVFRFFSQSLQTNACILLLLGNDHFFSNPFQFIILQSIPCYIIKLQKASQIIHKKFLTLNVFFSCVLFGTKIS
jgi:hypothetical protein